MIAITKLLNYCSVCGVIALFAFSVPLFAETPEETAIRIAKEEQLQKDKEREAEEFRKQKEEARKIKEIAEKREKDRKAEATRKANAIAAQKEKDRKEEREKEAARIAGLQRQCEKKGGDWKRGECVMPPPPKPKPKAKPAPIPEPVVVVEPPVRQAPATTYDPNLWWKDARTGCLIWRSDVAKLPTATWNGICGSDGKAQGNGTVTYFNASGSWVNSLTCTFQRGKCDGQGVYTAANGDRFEGELQDSNYNGQGVYTFANGGRYEGQYRDGKYNGQGVLTFANGDRYEGQFRDNKSNGQGVYTAANGDRYEGQFRDNKFNGYGKYYKADGSLDFEGQWVNNERVR